MQEKKLHAFTEGSKLIQKLICSKEKCSGDKSAGFCSHCRTLEQFYGKANSPTGIDSIWLKLEDTLWGIRRLFC